MKEQSVVASFRWKADDGSTGEEEQCTGDDGQSDGRASDRAFEKIDQSSVRGRRGVAEGVI